MREVENSLTHSDRTDFEPAPFLVQNADLLPKGWALDVAMGFGQNALYLAQLGFDVEGVDKSPEAVEKALELTRNTGLTIRATVADLESDYSIQQDRYDVVIVFYYLQRSLIREIKEGIKVGGMVVYETFTVDQVQFGKPRNPDHLLKHKELLDMFRDFRCLRYREGIFEPRKAVASIVAQKVISEI